MNNHSEVFVLYDLNYYGFLQCHLKGVYFLAMPSQHYYVGYFVRSCRKKSLEVV